MKIIYCITALLLCGCASVGTPVETQNIPKIRKGVTTEAELVQMFGAPSSKRLGPNNGLIETWIYSESRVKGTSFIPYAGAFVGGSHVKIQTLMVALDGNGRVQNYAFNESHPDINFGANN